jgi:hypothetical protein
MLANKTCRGVFSRFVTIKSDLINRRLNSSPSSVYRNIIPIMNATRLSRALLLFTCSATQLFSQAPSATPPPVTFTADQAHQNMMSQLVINPLRPGPSG